MRRFQGTAAPGASLEDAALVGGVLRERRLERGLTVEDVGRAIRFGAQHVQAVEEGRFHALPPPPYGRGLITAYATLVGIEPRELLRVSRAALSPLGTGGRTRIFRQPLRQRMTWREWTVPFAMTVVVVAIIAVRAVLTPAPVELAEPAGNATVAPRPVQPAPEVEDASLSPAPGEQDPAVAPGVRVVLRCEGTTWVEAATDGSEARRHELGPGQTLELTARERLGLSLGDAGVVRVRVGDRELGFIGDKGETRTGLMFVAPKPSAAAAAHTADGD